MSLQETLNDLIKAAGGEDAALPPLTIAARLAQDGFAAPEVD